MSNDKPLSAKHTLLQCIYTVRQRLGHSTPVLSIEQDDDIARLEADRKWRDLSISTDFEAVGGFKVYLCERGEEGKKSVSTD